MTLGEQPKHNRGMKWRKWVRVILSLTSYKIIINLNYVYYNFKMVKNVKFGIFDGKNETGFKYENLI